MNNYTSIAKVLILFILSLQFVQLNGQNFEERLRQPITNCEIIATNSQKFISSFGISQRDSIQAILAIWERECGNIEPIQRVKILLAIYDNQLEASDYTFYFEEKVDRYKYRMACSRYSDYAEFYENNKARFSYVKLRGVFDNWTKDIAEILLQIYPNGSDEYLICLLFTNNLTDFLALSASKPYKKSNIAHSSINYNSYNHRGGFSLLIGAWQPIGQMTENFTLSPQLGGGLNIPFGPKYRVDFKLLVTGFLDKKELVFNIEDEEIATSSYSNVNVGFLFSREFKLSQKYFFDINTGLSMSVLDTNIDKKEQTENEEDYSIETFNLELGFRAWKKVGQHQNIGFNAAIHYVPYNINEVLITTTGSWYIDYTLIFKF